MAKNKRLNPNSQGYTNALLEDMNEKFQVILESTEPIPKMQEQINHILTWEEDIKLIPSIFDEVGELRKDVEILKAATKLLDRHDERLDNIDKRLSAVEQRVR